MITFQTDLELDNLSAAESAALEIKDNPMAGWFNVPVDSDELLRIKTAAQRIQSNSEYLVCIGIGGSYLGHKAVIDALGERSNTKIIYTGNSLSSFELQKVLKTIDGKDFSINVISKSGTTTEPAIAFRILKQKLFEKYGEDAKSRIFATTDSSKGALHDEASVNGYEMFVVPDNIGGRYSVLTAVGLLPIAVAGIDIDQLIEGAKDVYANPESAYAYAVTRQKLYLDKKETEILATFEPRLTTFNEWWKQLFGESEGKNNQGIFPASVVYSTDLHSLGQYLQQGRRNIFETVVKITTPSENPIVIPEDQNNTDELNYLAGKSLDFVNNTALEATVAAHKSGDIAVNIIEIPDITERSVGQLIYFFELACAISATLSGVDPFNQPGVETYKTNMFKLLGKPGF